MFFKALISVMFAAALGGTGVAAAQLTPLGTATEARVVSRTADPSSQQIYAAAAAGNLGQAQHMIEQVLRDHPSSAQAHYVAAEVYARSRELARARQELHTAEQLSPGLSFARPASVASLERELGAGRMSPAGHGFSWGGIVLVLAIGALIYALLRRRAAINSYGQAYPPYGANPYAANPYGPVNPPYPGGYGPGYGGPMGARSGLMGNLATGLAVGAGVAAGEELVEHAFGSHSAGGVIPSADAAGLPDPGVNADMGGADFGLTDGGSWDSGGGGDPFGGGGDLGGSDFGAGGGDWT
ncbi:MAG TPA: tetratricopeptide repeat protein [Steroidobacteraceae bacterium]|nr:tetratricopeptide repeat protein [Steroidobacteraceae bacterium]